MRTHKWKYGARNSYPTGVFAASSKLVPPFPLDDVVEASRRRWPRFGGVVPLRVAFQLDILRKPWRPRVRTPRRWRRWRSLAPFFATFSVGHRDQHSTARTAGFRDIDCCRFGNAFDVQTGRDARRADQRRTPGRREESTHLRPRRPDGRRCCSGPPGCGYCSGGPAPGSAHR